MIRRLNYTKRTKIKAGDIGISIREVSGAAPVATASVSLEDYDFPSDAEIVVEAYRKAAYMRVSLGPLASIQGEHEFTLSEFQSADGVRFRVKAIGRSDETRHHGPLLLGAADRISPREDNDGEADYEKLLPLVPDDLNGEVWKLDLEDGPVLHLERAYWDERSQVVRSGWFFPLVLPTVLRGCLVKALEDDYRDLDDDDDWRTLWLRFALSLPGERELPRAGEELDWIDARVAAFCRDQKIRDRFDPALRGGAS